MYTIYNYSISVYKKIVSAIIRTIISFIYLCMLKITNNSLAMINYMFFKTFSIEIRLFPFLHRYTMVFWFVLRIGQYCLISLFKVKNSHTWEIRYVDANSYFHYSAAGKIHVIFSKWTIYKLYIVSYEFSCQLVLTNALFMSCAF